MDIDKRIATAESWDRVNSQRVWRLGTELLDDVHDFCSPLGLRSVVDSLSYFARAIGVRMGIGYYRQTPIDESPILFLEWVSRILRYLYQNNLLQRGDFRLFSHACLLSSFYLVACKADASRKWGATAISLEGVDQYFGGLLTMDYQLTILHCIHSPQNIEDKRWRKILGFNQAHLKFDVSNTRRLLEQRFHLLDASDGAGLCELNIPPFDLVPIELLALIKSQGILEYDLGITDEFQGMTDLSRAGEWAGANWANRSERVLEIEAVLDHNLGWLWSET